VIETLQEFWKKKLLDEKTDDHSFVNETAVCYAVEPATNPPFTCYVTLPNGCCFANLLSVSVHVFLSFFHKLLMMKTERVLISVRKMSSLQW